MAVKPALEGGEGKGFYSKKLESMNFFYLKGCRNLNKHLNYQPIY